VAAHEKASLGSALKINPAQSGIKDNTRIGSTSRWGMGTVFSSMLDTPDCCAYHCPEGNAYSGRFLAQILSPLPVQDGAWRDVPVAPFYAAIVLAL